MQLQKNLYPADAAKMEPSVPPESSQTRTPAVAVSPSPQKGFLNKLGLDRPELRAWAMYDFGNSAFMTIIITAIFPIFYSSVASDGIDKDTSAFRFSMATAGAMIVIAILAPILGAVADFAPIKKRMIAGFLS